KIVNFISCFCSSRRRHTRFSRDWSSDVCSSDLGLLHPPSRHPAAAVQRRRIADRAHHVGHRGDGSRIHRGGGGVIEIHRLGGVRSEERRVGKEGGCSCSACTERKITKTTMTCAA